MKQHVTATENQIFGLTGREIPRKLINELKHTCNFCGQDITKHDEYLKTFSNTKRSRYYHYSCVVQELLAGRITFKTGDPGLVTMMNSNPHLYTPPLAR